MVLISFDYHKKIHNFSKFGGCGSKIEPATPISILNFRRAWQGQIWSHTHQILKICAFFEDKEMMLVPFFQNSAQILVNWKKLIFYLKFRPHFEQID